VEKRARVRALIVLLAALAGCGAGGSPTAQTVSPGVVKAGPCGKRDAPPRRYAHVVWVVMENQAYGSIIGSGRVPYVNVVAAQCGSAANFHAETHPSLPNYIAMTSGSTHGVTDDNSPSSHPLEGPSIFSQLGSGWRSLEESMPSKCARAPAGGYAVKHNPAAYYTNIRRACAAQDVPLGPKPDLSARFTFVTPNLCDDMHDCPPSVGDHWLRGFLRTVFASAEYRAGTTAVFVTWDEDDTSHGNHIATLVVAPTVRPGIRPRPFFNHYSMLRTTEQMLGLGFIGDAAKAASMRRAFGI
jgi:hypothetical protein